MIVISDYPARLEALHKEFNDFTLKAAAKMQDQAAQLADAQALYEILFEKVGAYLHLLSSMGPTYEHTVKACQELRSFIIAAPERLEQAPK